MIVVIWVEEEKERLEIELPAIEAYIQLVKKYGYLDDDGEEYKFRFAHVESGQVTIYLVEET